MRLPRTAHGLSALPAHQVAAGQQRVALRRLAQRQRMAQRAHRRRSFPRGQPLYRPALQRTGAALWPRRKRPFQLVTELTPQQQRGLLRYFLAAHLNEPLEVRLRPLQIRPLCTGKRKLEVRLPAPRAAHAGHAQVRAVGRLLAAHLVVDAGELHLHVLVLAELCLRAGQQGHRLVIAPGAAMAGSAPDEVFPCPLKRNHVAHASPPSSAYAAVS